MLGLGPDPRVPLILLNGMIINVPPHQTVTCLDLMGCRGVEKKHQGLTDSFPDRPPQ